MRDVSRHVSPCGDIGRRMPSKVTPDLYPVHNIRASIVKEGIGGMPVTSERGASVLLEAGFPVRALSEAVRADRRNRDAAYGAHRWFARRPPALFRGILIAACMPAGSSEGEFWKAYAEDARLLEGKTVFDPFVGGGTTLVEAGRLGARVGGRDIDPISIRLVGHELDPPKPADFEEARQALLSHLHGVVGHLYPFEGDVLPLHTFSVARVTCPSCEFTGPMYRTPVIARGVGKAGSVSRPEGVTAFCPTCGDLQCLPLSARYLNHCGSRFDLSEGTWRGTKYVCPACAQPSTHSDLLTGAAPRWTVAVEETVRERGVARRFRPPGEGELTLDAAARALMARRRLSGPTAPVPADNADGRPASFGMPTFADLFTPRQLALFAEGFGWIAEAATDERVSRALHLGLSNALASNNRMCGYATDYGRLSALFSVRGYSLPILSVELNALHPDSGRGTLPKTMNRVSASLAPVSSRTVATAAGGRKRVRWEHQLGEAMKLTHGPAQESSEGDLPGRAKADLVITDPPYFDYISYDSLSAFYRAWHLDDELAGVPVLPIGEEPVSHFGQLLGASLGASRSLLKDGGVVAFTYHSLNPQAWQALALALRVAELRVTALWPVLADPHMGHHGTTGACQYDLVVVSRPVEETDPARPPAASAGEWMQALDLDLSEPDVMSCTLAFGALAHTWGELR